MSLNQALLTEYDTIVCVDRSGSMASPAPKFPSRWKQAEEITVGLAGLADKVDDDGITVISFGGNFKPERDVKDGVRMSAVADVFSQNSPSGSTPLTDALKAAVAKKFSGNKKGIIFVVTDGTPDDPASVASTIVGATNRLSSPDELRILFIQVGDDPGATNYLRGLDDNLKGAKFDIVDHVGFEKANGLTAEDLYERALKDGD